MRSHYRTALGRDGVKTRRPEFSLKGCEIVAGGRSVAQTTGMEPHVVRTLKECHRFSDTRSGWGIIFRLLFGGLRCATTTGYFLPAFQAETPSWRRMLDSIFNDNGRQ
jgi:hypothetical protein